MATSPGSSRAPSAGASDPSPAAPDGAAEDGGAGPVSGWSSTYLRFRRTADAEDLDLIETLSLDIGDSERDAVTGHLLVYAAAALSGRDYDADDDFDFFDLDDTSDSDVVAHLYDAYADVHSLDAFRAVRLGRQSLFDTPEVVWFDGFWLESEPAGARDTSVGAYFGRGVRLYETAVDGDRVAGTYVETHPWRAGRVRLDWLHLEDDTRLLDERDDLWSLRAWQRLNDELRVSGGLTRLGSEPRDYHWRADWYDAGSDLGAQVHYYELTEPQGNLAFELDPFSSFLFELQPYRQWDLQASKGLGEHVSVEAGVALRDVTKAADEGEFNREFDRRHVSLNLTELPGAVDVTLTGAVYDDGGTDIDTWGADLSRDLGSAWRASLGSYYSLYRIDLFEDVERDHVRSWYARARRKGGKDLTLDLRVEYEEDDFDDYLVTRVGLRWAF
jgi:hypothetical protein